MSSPGFDHDECNRAILEALEIEGVDRLYPGIEKAKPLPNFKLQIEQIKAQVKQLQIKSDQQKWASELLEAKRLNDAQILKLTAEAITLMKKAETEDIKTKLAAIESVIEAHAKYGEMINQRIESLMGAGQNANSDGEGMGELGSPSSDQGLQGLPSPGATGANGAMGGGAVHG